MMDVTAPKATYNVKTLISDLRQGVIEITTKERGIFWVTLRPDLLPISYAQGEYKEELDFHVKNPTKIACWKIKTGGWVQLEVEEITYAQARETF